MIWDEGEEVILELVLQSSREHGRVSAREGLGPAVISERAITPARCAICQIG